MNQRFFVLLVAASLAGCGPPADAPATPEAAAVLATVSRGLGGEPATLDPALAADNAALALLQDLFEGLTAEAADGSLIPGAADSWTVSPDSLRWSFKLRPDLRWSNGEALTAAAFVAGLDRARDPASQAPYAELLDAVRTVRAPDLATVVIELSRPLPALPAVLAMPFAGPIHLTHPTFDGTVTNGPYRVLARHPGEDVELVRNVRFHAVDTVAIPHITYLTLDDLNTELNLYRSGHLDITSEVPNSQLGWLRENLPGELHVAPYLSTYAYVPNQRRVPDRDVRTALAMAVDRQQIVGQVTGAGEQAAWSWVPPGMPDYSPARFDWSAEPAAALSQRARALWTAASKRGAAPTHLTLCTDASANHHRTAVALVDQWRRTLGVVVEIVELEWKAYLAMREQPDECDLVRFGWSADLVDPEAFLALFTTGSPQNVAGYSNAAYDALIAKARVAADAGQRTTILVAAEKILLQDGVVIPVFHRVSKRLVKPGIEGIAANPLGHLPSRYLRLRDSKNRAGGLRHPARGVDREVRGSV